MCGEDMVSGGEEWGERKREKEVFKRTCTTDLK